MFGLVAALSLAGYASAQEAKSGPAAGEFSVKSIDEQHLPASIRQSLLEQVRLMREHKVIPVRDDQIPDFAALAAQYRARAPDFAQLLANGGLNMAPANVDATSLRGLSPVGAAPCGTYVGRGWTGLERMFAHPTLGYVVLEEMDLTKSGGGVISTKEMINADVNGAPAVLVSKQGSGTRAVSTVAWFAHGISYTLRAPRVDDTGREALLSIARGLARQGPARDRE
ncbi:hypothetical protein [Massilia sp. DWR3-1-1]|uniref:hypothetical protein n=1 Tax=Massilia sp. DWR3-1-1 TaxID=2804559 RepID=UPI003CE89F5F